MQSKTLSSNMLFNATLFRKNLTRFWPLWGMASFLGSLAPLAMLVQLMHNGAVTKLEATQMYYTVLVNFIPVVSLCYAVLCAMVVWSYLYNARSVGLMHTLPIRRQGLFVTNFLSGMAMMLIPYVITGALCVLVSLAYGCFEPVGLLNTILGVAGESFFYFASATFVAFLTGNIFALPALYFLAHFLAPLLDFLVSTLAGGFLFGVDSSYSGVVEFLSPTVYLMRRLGMDWTYKEVERVSDLGNHFTEPVLASVELKNLWLVGVYALVGVVLLALSWVLYRHRRSETAGDVAATGWLRPVFRYAGATLAAMLGGLALYAIFFENYQNGRYFAAVPMAVCMFIAGAIGWYIATMLLAKSLRVFRGSWKGIAVVAVGCAVLCAALRFDVLGAASRVPELADVKQVELQAGDNNYVFYPGEEDDLLEQVRQLHQAVLADREYYMAADRADTRFELATEKGGYEYLRLVYTLKSGMTVARSYNLFLTEERMAQAGTADHLLDQLVNSEAMKAKRLHAGDSRYVVEEGSVWSEQRSSGFDLSSREAQALLDAVARDAAAGNWGDYNWFENDQRGDYAVGIDLTFAVPKTDGVTGSYYDCIRIRLRPEMTETVKCLLDMGALTEGDLVTLGELYPEDYQNEKYPEMTAEEAVNVVTYD